MSFKPTLAVNAELDKIRYPVYASPKLDGIRCSIVEGKALSRTLKPIPNKHIYNKLSDLGLNGLDGELIVGSPTSTTVYNDTVSAVMRHTGTPAATYYVFDVHNMELATYAHRLGHMRQKLEFWQDFSGFDIQLLPQTLCANKEALLDYENECVDVGYEGIIVRAMSAPYKYGRSTVNEGYLLKVKRFEDSEALIIGFEEEMFNGNEAQTNELGRTKRSTAFAGLSGKNTLGAFLVRDVVTDVEFAIGTGFTALQRGVFWQRQEDYLNTIIKYKFFPVGVKDKPRHPVYLGPRPSGA